ncbi:MAG: hypothetical protein JXR07_20555 [Reichenbachiella sp.]
MPYFFAGVNIKEEVYQLLNVTWRFHRALEILQAHGENQALYKLLSKSPDSSFYNKKLKQELSQLELEPINVTIKLDGSAQLDIIQKISLPPTSVDDWPKALHPTIRKRNEAVKRRGHLKARLTVVSTNAERYDIAKYIVELDEVIDSAWDTISYFKEYKSLPIQLPDDELEKLFFGKSDVQINKTKTNYRTYLSKAKRGGRNKDLIPQYEAVLAECERRLTNE